MAAGKADRGRPRTTRPKHSPATGQRLDLATSIGSDYSSLYQADGFSDQFFDDNPDAAVGLTLSIPIFDRQQTRNQVAQARIRQDDARLSLLQQQLQAETELGQATAGFRARRRN